MEAQFLKTELERVLGAEVFLDSDDLKDLRKLGEHVVDSDVLVLLQSAEVLLRPWCVYELVTAIKADVPIVAVTSKPFPAHFGSGEVLTSVTWCIEIAPNGSLSSRYMCVSSS